MLRAATPQFMTVGGAGTAGSPNIGGSPPPSADTSSSPCHRQVPVYTNCLLKQSDGLPRMGYSDPAWNFCSDAEEVSPSSPDVGSLGQVPSMEEVQVATHQLRDTMQRNFLPRQQQLEPSRLGGLLEPAGNGQSSVHYTAELGGLLDYGSSGVVPYSRSVSRNQLVGQALELFGHDRDVQDAVVSLAQDPAIWQAIQQNDGVHSLLRRRRASMTVGHLESSDPDYIPEPVVPTNLQFLHKVKPSTGDPLGDFLQRMVVELNNVKKTLTSFAAKLFGTPLDSAPSADRFHDGMNLTGDDSVFPAVLILTILVVGIVVFNRPVVIG